MVGWLNTFFKYLQSIARGKEKIFVAYKNYTKFRFQC